MRVKIHTSKERVRDRLPEAGVSPELLRRVTEIARTLKRSDLILFWLEDAARESERAFNQWLKDIENFSKQELIDIIHELGPESLQDFVKRFQKR